MALDPALFSKVFPGPMGAGSMKDYPHLFPPPGFIPVDRNKSFALVSGGGETLLESIQLTDGYEGWIRLVGLQASTFTGFFFTMKDGGQPLRDYTRITVPLGQADSPQPIFIPLKANIAFSLHGANTSGANVALRWRLFGWYYKAGRAS